MIKQKLEGNYNKFKNYVLENGYVPNGNSCIAVDVGNCDMTMCLSDSQASVKVCEGFKLKQVNPVKNIWERSRELTDAELKSKFKDLLELVESDTTEIKIHNYLTNEDFIC